MYIGIDLGTTNSLVAVFRDGQAHLIPNAHGHVLTPSAVSVADDGTLLVGLAARERLASHPQQTAMTFKRWMGTDKLTRLGSKDYRAEELSAMVLKSLKADAEAYLGTEVTEAVVTVPAYFNDVQRRATKHAAELAGLKVERLLNEPTAAGLAYGLQERQDHSTFLVFDLGGGTFDVSVLEYFDGVVEVRSSAGDTRLGGEDFVAVLETLFLEKCENFSERDREQILASKALWRAAEQAKRDLTDADTVDMRLQWKDAAFTHTVSRAEFEAASDELIKRLRRPIERALSDARLAPNELSEVVLVGGASRMPLVRQTVTKLFQRLPLRTINPDETIARGAAIQAALKARDAALEEVVLTDVMPYSLGVIISEFINGRRFGDRFSPIIERNTPVPVSRVQGYNTISDNQRQILFDIRQGESPIGSENMALGVLEIDVPPKPAGQVSVNVRISYDANGMLEVEVKDERQQLMASTIIQPAGASMGADDIAQALERLRVLKQHPRDQQENIYLLERAKRLYEDRLGEQRQWLQRWIAQFEMSLDTQDAKEVARARDEFRAALDNLDKGFVF
ncbi:molecular chaperone HscC [Rhodoferax sp. TH121]|uniref:Hsp70 family protein n=1 Tax=Rhodoferax sp. TH121 TaxID=2022803 RepID=UPI000B97360E|nr:molecular chaperone HscC [Rhodoferax sp. TH121]OYQ38833.1 molecular chaperone HscC [Rhodoferax sp. TH121]